MVTDAPQIAGNGRPAAIRGHTVWHADPVQLALAGSALVARDDVLPDPFCIDVGRRILMAELEFSAWVLRRVESVSFEEGRSVLRRMSIEFRVRDDAPEFVVPAVAGGEDKRYWLVPLAVMNRRTLVDFKLEDEDHRALTLPGLRLAQRLDESVLLAAAATSTPVTQGLRTLVKQVVAGKRSEVTRAMDDLSARPAGDRLAILRDDPLFKMALGRLRYNFTLYVFLPVSAGRNRLLTMSFVEPIVWRYQRPRLEESDGAWTYAPMQPARVSLSHAASGLGWTATRMRFQTPSAEHAASYHFEVAAPKGVRIVEATLLAGRPHEPKERPTVDHVRGDSLTIGLHAVEVPTNSLCRAQIHLRVQRAGWLTTLLLATLAITAVLGSVTWHAVQQVAPDPSQDTNVIVVLIASAAATATFVAQRDFPGVAARMVTGARFVGALAMSLPVVAAGVLSYKEVSEPDRPAIQQLATGADLATRVWLWSLTGLSGLLFLLVLWTWLRTGWAERRAAETSPWDMTIHRERWPVIPTERAVARRRRRREEPELPDDFRVALDRFRFSSPAVGVRSSEGFHHKYCWNDGHQRHALDALSALGASPLPGHFPCGRPETCRHAPRNGCTATMATGAGNGATAARH